VSTDDEKGTWGKIGKFVGRVTDEYTNRPEIFVNVSSIPIIGPIIDNAFRIAASEFQKGVFLT
jgi:hypothetical protein